MPNDTIFALATPPGRSAIAVIRISGPATSAAVHALTPARLEPRRASVRRLTDPDTNALLDEAVVIFFPGPWSQTGEDTAELQLHGGKAVVRAVLHAMSQRPGLRPAEPGEFARRALENGKLDLAQVEGLADLIEAETDAQRLQAMAEATGVNSAIYESWRGDALSALALVSAAIDFTDEADVADDAVNQAEVVARRLSVTLSAARADQHRGEILRDGFRVVLAGAPNAGKSSLLNALARRDAAIVSDEAGTTRDTIEVRLDLDGWPVVITDTAGIRETVSNVEREGVRRTIAAAKRANLVLWLIEPGGPSNLSDELCLTSSPIIPVETKADLIQNADRQNARDHREQFPADGSLVEIAADVNLAPATAGSRRPAVRISTQTGEGLDGLTAMLSSYAKDATGRPGDAVISRLRHGREIDEATGALAAFLDGTKDEALEVRAEHLRRAASHIGRLTARIGTEDVLGEIFSRFCIGK